MHSINHDTLENIAQNILYVFRCLPNAWTVLYFTLKNTDTQIQRNAFDERERVNESANKFQYGFTAKIGYVENTFWNEREKNNNPIAIDHTIKHYYEHFMCILILWHTIFITNYARIIHKHIHTHTHRKTLYLNDTHGQSVYSSAQATNSIKQTKTKNKLRNILFILPTLRNFWQKKMSANINNIQKKTIV